MVTGPRESRVRIALVLPDLLGTYGDRGNAAVLDRRLAWRGMSGEVVEVTADTPVPDSCDIYLLGGGEDVAQRAAVNWLLTHQGMSRAVDRGAVVLAVCAGFQMLGTEFTGLDGVSQPGLGLIDATSAPLPTKAIGEIVTAPSQGTGSTQLTGFENHRCGTELGPEQTPAGTVTRGVGNGFGGVDGVVSGSVFGTYLHGPVLARNPELADILLARATDTDLPPLEVDMITDLRQERIRAATGRRSGDRAGSARPAVT